jgi:signal transduction histidine kinase
MSRERSTLWQAHLRQHAAAAVLTFGLMLGVMLGVADHLALQAAARTLAQELRASTASSAGAGMGAGRTGRLTLDATGRPLSGNGRGSHGGWGPGWARTAPQAAWATAATIRARGELQGIGRLPWLPTPVVWAARAVPGEAGEGRIILAWSRVAGIRAAARSTYLLVVIAIGLTLLVNLGFTRRFLDSLTRTLTAVTTAGRQMVAGDFAVQLPAQSTAELDDVRAVVTDLAAHLDHTLADLRAEHARLARLEGAQRQFVADASHELRAPLSVIALTLDAWHDGLLRPDEQPDALDGLRGEVKRLSRMVEQLLDLSRIESGRQPLALQALVPHLLAGQVARTFERTPGAPIHQEVPMALPPVLADPDAVHRMLFNLLDNARRFTPADGVIRLWARAEDDRIVFGVTDTGSGIAAEAVERMWDRFARADRVRAAQDTGSGLGLAIVKALAEAMNGTVGLTSADGGGTTAWFSLPCAKT